MRVRVPRANSPYVAELSVKRTGVKVPLPLGTPLLVRVKSRVRLLSVSLEFRLLY